MVQPYNYQMAGIQSPFESVVQGLRLGATLETLQAQREQQRQAAMLAQQQAEQQRAAATRSSELMGELARGTITQAGIAELASLAGGEANKRGLWALSEQMGKDRRNSVIGQNAQLSVAMALNPAVALQAIDRLEAADPNNPRWAEARRLLQQDPMLASQFTASGLLGMGQEGIEAYKLVAQKAGWTLQQDERDRAIIQDIMGGGSGAVPAEAAAPAVAPAAMPAEPVAPVVPAAVTPAAAAVPAAAAAPMAAPPVAPVAAQPGIAVSDMIEGGAAGTATTSAVGGGVGRPTLTTFMPPMPSRAEYEEAMRRASVLRQQSSQLQQMAFDPGLTDEQRLQAQTGLQNLALLEQQNNTVIGNYLANMGEAELPGGLIEPTRLPVRLELPPEQIAPAAAQPVATTMPAAPVAQPVPATAQPMPPVQPAAARAAPTAEAVRVAGPVPAGAFPTTEKGIQDRVAELRRQRTAFETVRGLSNEARAARITAINAELRPLEQELLTRGRPSDAEKRYQEAVAGGYTGTRTDFKKLSGAQVQVFTGEQQSAFERALGPEQAKSIMADFTAAKDAAEIIRTVEQGRELLRGPIITGFAADAITQIGAALNQAGISFARDAVANTQAFTANMAQNVAKLIKQFGAGTGLSNDDRIYATKMAGGQVTLDKAAIEKILDINERAARNVILLHNKQVKDIQSIIPLTVEMPPMRGGAGAQPGSGVDRNNPLLK